MRVSQRLGKGWETLYHPPHSNISWAQKSDINFCSGSLFHSYDSMTIKKKKKEKYEV